MNRERLSRDWNSADRSCVSSMTRPKRSSRATKLVRSRSGRAGVTPLAAWSQGHLAARAGRRRVLDHDRRSSSLPLIIRVRLLVSALGAGGRASALPSARLACGCAAPSFCAAPSGFMPGEARRLVAPAAVRRAQRLAGAGGAPARARPELYANVCRCGARAAPPARPAERRDSGARAERAHAACLDRGRARGRRPRSYNSAHSQVSTDPRARSPDAVGEQPARARSLNVPADRR